MLTQPNTPHGLDAIELRRLRQRLNGSLIGPGDPGYETARRSAGRDLHPALIARCQGLADVVTAVRFAHAQGLTIATRGASYTATGPDTPDGTMLVDLTHMRRIYVDPEARFARVEAGATLGEVDRATQLYGLATPAGTLEHLGFGLTARGGFSWLRRKHGMSVDNLRAVEVVRPDGSVVRASAAEAPDLYRAVLGGGHVGVVTAGEFRLYEVGPQVSFAAVFYRETGAAALVRAWREWTATAPDEVSSDVLLWRIPADPAYPEALHDRRVAIVAGLYAGPVEPGLQVLQPLRALAEPLLDRSGPLTYVAAQTLFDAFVPDGLYHYGRSLSLQELTDAAIAGAVAKAADPPSPHALVAIRHLGGAVHRAQYLLGVDAFWSDPSDADLSITWARNFRRALQPHTDVGFA